MSIANTHLNLYDKTPRKGRKVGHATVRADNDATYQEEQQQLTKLALAVDHS